MLAEIALVLSTALNVTNTAIFVDIITSFLSIPHAITVRGLVRYSARSERSWFRFLSEEYDWIKGRVALFNKFSYVKKVRYFLAFDETMEGKVGKSTHGIGYFYNSILQIAQRGIGFAACSLVSTQTKVSYFMGLQQIVRTPEDIARTAAAKEKEKVRKENKKKRNKGETAPAKKPVGRPKGSKNKNKNNNKDKNQIETETTENVVETPSFRTFKALLTAIIKAIRLAMPDIRLEHIIGDNAYATLQYLELAESLGLFLLSKLKYNSVICLPHEANEEEQKKQGKGRPKTYGSVIDNKNPPKHTLKATKTEDNIYYEYFQFLGYAKGCFKMIKLNILILRATDLNTKKVGIVILFSNDLTLTQYELLDFYRLRFQIEFDFRDAKQSYGFSTFKNYTETNVTNFANLIMLMVLVTKIILPKYREQTNNDKLSINDLKIIFNARFNIKSFYIYAEKATTSIFNLENIDKFIPNHIINAA